MEEYQSGEPPRPGWYDCLINDEEEDRLQWWVCVMNPRRKRWKDIRGQYVEGNVKWAGKATANP